MSWWSAGARHRHMSPCRAGEAVVSNLHGVRESSRYDSELPKLHSIVWSSRSLPRTSSCVPPRTGPPVGWIE